MCSIRDQYSVNMQDYRMKLWSYWFSISFHSTFDLFNWTVENKNYKAFYTYLYSYKYENVCLFVCLYPFFSAISKPIGKPYGMKLVFDPEKKLKQ